MKYFTALTLALFFSLHTYAKSGLIETPLGPKFAFYEKKGDYFLTEWDILVEPYRRSSIKNEKANSRRFGK